MLMTRIVTVISMGAVPTKQMYTAVARRPPVKIKSITLNQANYRIIPSIRADSGEERGKNHWPREYRSGRISPPSECWQLGKGDRRSLNECTKDAGRRDHWWRSFTHPRPNTSQALFGVLHVRFRWWAIRKVDRWSNSRRRSLKRPKWIRRSFSPFRSQEWSEEPVVPFESPLTSVFLSVVQRLSCQSLSTLRIIAVRRYVGERTLKRKRIKWKTTWCIDRKMIGKQTRINICARVNQNKITGRGQVWS